jgi:hypothetical protein
MAWVTQARNGWQALARPSVIPFGLLGIGLLYTARHSRNQTALAFPIS